ncbi:MAG: hypothetical protein ACRCXD_12840 [Luteolibacter sp.]
MTAMKSCDVAISLLLLSQSYLTAQEVDVGSKGSETRTFIPAVLEVPAFTPPAPPVETPVPAMRIDSAITVPSGKSHTLAILRGEASDLPDIPAPVITAQRPPRLPTPEELARRAEARRLDLNFNAEVHENGVSIIRWHHPDTAEPYQAICGFDINLLAGVGQFISGGKTYQLSFIPPGVTPAKRHRLTKLPFPEPPEAAPNSIIFLKGNPDDPIGTATAILLRDLIITEKERLITYQEKRSTYFQAAADWQKANPVLPRDETLWFRPHRGSRYLTNPTPEKGAAK